MTATIDAPTLPGPQQPPYPPVVVRRLPAPEPGITPPGGSPTSAVPPPIAGPEPAPRPPVVPGKPRTEVELTLRLIMEMLDGRRPATRAGGRIGPMALRYVVAARCRLNPAGRRSGTARHGPPGVRSIRMSHPAEGVTEASAVWHYRGRARALAARFEWHAGRWRCTVLRLG